MDGLLTETGRWALAQGVLGVYALLATAVAYLLYRELRACDNKRFDELNRVIEARESLNKALTTNSLALEANNRAMEARTRATEEMARQIEALRTQNSWNDAEVRKTLDEVIKTLDEFDRTLRDRKRGQA